MEDNVKLTGTDKESCDLRWEREEDIHAVQKKKIFFYI